MESRAPFRLKPYWTRLCNSEARDFVANGYGGVRSLVGPVDWSTYFETAEDLERAEAIVGTRALDSLHNAFEHYWMFALGQIGSEDRIQSDGHGNTSVETKPTGHFGYQIAFSLVEEKLKNAPKGRKPGWDLTPLGYIAKTCVDQEFFSNGPISGDCVISATFVDKVGTPVGSQIRH